LSWGDDVRAYDGRIEFDRHGGSANPYANWIPRGHCRNIHKGHTITYSFAVTLLGIGVSSTTTYTTGTEQVICAEMATAHLHWEWGRDGSYTSGHAHVLYSC
jgi:hypothetical protein